MTETVKDMLDLAVECDMSMVAHHTYWAITQNAVTLQDSIDKLMSIQVDKQAVQSLIESNMLGIGRIKLFVVKTVEPNVYAFYFAKDALEARAMYESKFGEVKGITNGARLMPNKMLFADTRLEMTLFEYRKRIVHFPAYLGHAKAQENVLYRLGV